MSAVSNKVMPRAIGPWITFREVSRWVRWPKLLQPRPTAETRRPEPPRLRICMDQSCGMGSARRDHIVTATRGGCKRVSGPRARRRSLLRGAQMSDRGTIRAATHRDIEVGLGGIVGMPNEVGHRRIAQHPS